MIGASVRRSTPDEKRPTQEEGKKGTVPFFKELILPALAPHQREQDSVGRVVEAPVRHDDQHVPPGSLVPPPRRPSPPHSYRPELAHRCSGSPPRSPRLSSLSSVGISLRPTGAKIHTSAATNASGVRILMQTPRRGGAPWLENGDQLSLSTLSEARKRLLHRGRMMREIIVDMHTIRDPHQLLAALGSTESGEGGDQPIERCTRGFARHCESGDRIAGVMSAHQGQVDAPAQGPAPE